MTPVNHKPMYNRYLVNVILKSKAVWVNEPRTKATFDMPKSIMKRVKQYALDTETNSLTVVVEALEMFLSTKEKKKK